MKTLLSSLLVMVLCGMIGLGWLANRYYSSVQKPSPQHDTLQAYKNMGRILATHLSKNPSAITSLNTTAIHLADTHQLPNIQSVKASDIFLPPSLSNKLNNHEIITLEEDTEITLYVAIPQSQNILTLTLPSAAVTPPRTRHELVLTLAFYAGMIIVIFLWFYPLFRRLLLLEKTSTRFGKGDISARIPTSRFTYIHSIESTFNHMADRIQGLLADNKLLSRAVSHDLKTPLARLRFGVDVWADSKNQAQSLKYYHRISQDLDEMESLIQTLLDYAHMEEANIKLQQDLTDLNGFIKDVIQTAEHPSHSIQLHLDKQSPVILADPQYLKMLINNIVENALNYAASTVAIETRTLGESATLVISDDGPGIAEEEVPCIAKPFIKGGALGRKKGHGMGLAIVDKISNWHHATLTIGRCPKLGGAAISVTFALAENNA